jgi:hypothetical protein
MKRDRYTPSLEASLSATISASQDDSATLVWRRLPQLMAACAYVKTKPVVECFTAQSESLMPDMSISDAP